jgi:hypothetical protein
MKSVVAAAPGERASPRGERLPPGVTGGHRPYPERRDHRDRGCAASRRGSRRRAGRRVVRAAAGSAARPVRQRGRRHGRRGQRPGRRGRVAHRRRCRQLVDTLTVITGFDRIDATVLNGAGPTLRARAWPGTAAENEREHSPSPRWRHSRWRDTAWLRGSTSNGWPNDAPPPRAGRRVATAPAHGRVPADLHLLADRTAADLPARRAARGSRRLVRLCRPRGRHQQHLVAAAGACPETVATPSLPPRSGTHRRPGAAPAPSAGMRNLLVHRYGDIRWTCWLRASPGRSMRIRCTSAGLGLPAVLRSLITVEVALLV